MRKAAIKAAKFINYEGVGTVEFLVDNKKKFLFHGDEHKNSGRTPNY